MGETTLSEISVLLTGLKREARKQTARFPCRLGAGLFEHQHFDLMGKHGNGKAPVPLNQHESPFKILYFVTDRAIRGPRKVPFYSTDKS